MDGKERCRKDGGKKEEKGREERVSERCRGGSTLIIRMGMEGESRFMFVNNQRTS